MKRFVFWAIVAAALWATTGQAQTERQVTFCSYNLKNWLQMERFQNGKRTEGVGKPEKEKAAAVRILTAIHPDILGVCEIGTEEDLRDLQARLRAVGIDLPYSESAHGGDPVRRLGILSRLPIVEKNSQTGLKYLIGNQVFAVSRGFLDVTVKLREGLDLRCVGVHLKSKREVPEADQGLMRRNEAHLLRRHTDTILRAKPETKLLLYGDFNEHKAEAAIVEIEGVPGMELSMNRLNLKDSRGETWTHYWEYQDLYSRFDYFFVSRPLQSYVDKRASYIFDALPHGEASDHRPLVMKIDLVKSR